MIRQKYKLNPTIEWFLSDSQVTAELPFFGIKVSGHPELRKICDLISDVESSSFPESELDFDKSLIRFLVEHYFLLEEQEYEYMQFGLTKQAALPIGGHLSLLELMQKTELGDIVILHAPLELSQIHTVSVAAGGQRVREHLYSTFQKKSLSTPSDEIVIDFDLERQMQLSDIRIRDLGDIVFYPELESASVIGRRTTKVIESILDRGCYPVTFGGDHAITFYILESVRKRVTDFGIIHFDAHHDFYSSGNVANITNSVVNHANVLHHIYKMQEIRIIHQIGLRDLYRPPATGHPESLNERVKFISCRNAETAPIETLLKTIDPDIPYYLTFDVDVLDSGKDKGTATPLLGGLSYWRAFELMQQIFSRYQIIGLDFVEIGGQTTSAYSTADFAARMVMLFAFSIRPTQPMSTYVFT